VAELAAELKTAAKQTGKSCYIIERRNSELPRPQGGASKAFYRHSQSFGLTDKIGQQKQTQKA
jgi:hypothetical protein